MKDTESQAIEVAPDHANDLAGCAATIIECMRKAKSADRETLQDLCLAGQALNEAKALLSLDRGRFGRWCEETRLPCNKTWRARLMRLATHWDTVVVAVEAKDEDQRNWSVNSALATWQAAQPKKPSDRPRAMTATELRHALEAAQARIQQLEAQLEERKRQSRRKGALSAHEASSPLQFDSGAYDKSHGADLASTDSPAASMEMVTLQ